MTTRFCPIASVKIRPNRQREEFDPGELHELAESIQKPAGLLHAPVFEQEGETLYLVAGERRLRAITDIYDLGGKFNYCGEEVPFGMVPYNLLTDLTPLERMEVEYEENARRAPLTWQEQAKATAALAALRQAQAADKGAPPPTLLDIHTEVHGPKAKLVDTTRRELILARYLDSPDIAAAKTRDEAFKILKRKEEAARNEQLALTVGSSFSSRSHTLLNEDAFEWVKGQADAQFDMIVTDPPYGMGADTFGDSGGGAAGEHFYEDSADILSSILLTFPQEYFRITKPDAHAYIFCDIERFSAWKSAMEEAGWRVFRTPLIWFKPSAYRAPWPEMGPQRKYECILFAVKGQRKVNRLYGDVIQYDTDKNLGHNAQKPVELYCDLLRRSSRPGDKVLDTFGGTGPLLPAANVFQCSATVIEKNSAAYGIAASRLKALEVEDLLS